MSECYKYNTLHNFLCLRPIFSLKCPNYVKTTFEVKKKDVPTTLFHYLCTKHISELETVMLNDGITYISVREAAKNIFFSGLATKTLPRG